MRPGSSPWVPSALVASAVVVSFLATACSSGGHPEAKPPASPSKVTLPPVHAGFDYQLGGPSTLPTGVTVVARDHTAPPAQGIYNICYVNAFQAQPGAEKEWDAGLLLRDKGGEVVMDEDWGEAILDIGTDAKRKQIARKVNTWIDACAANGYQAVEPDNYDSYTRVPDGLLTADDAKAFLSLLSTHAHAQGLAIGQKNTAALAPARAEVGLDFAVVEECGQYDECGDFTDAFGDNVLVIEYSEQGLKRACQGWGDEISIIRRDLNLVPAGSEGYLRGTCSDS
ncbi:endo alpha-1,4 polygalactosaminidase [Streptomyces sp. NPDC057445]|uniref:endo alpha-1,4 polygalactosaminidase n=1 Tax=Streptomyces sp. NPDC057445 TaxID=3346136 RepID=UPI0036A9CDBE